MAETALIVLIFVFGACVGSFLNVIVHRMPRDESIVFPASHCPACGHPIRWFDNIPILSWIALRGRCRDCGAAISIRYLLVEAATGVMLAALYVLYFVLRVRTLGASGAVEAVGEDLNIAHAWPMFIAHGVLLCGLLAVALVDLEHYIVPLSVMWFAAVIGAGAAGLRPHPFGPTASATTAAMSLAAACGLSISGILVAVGWLRPSFHDLPEPPPHADDGDESQPASVGFTADDGVRPRVEMLWELLYLTPAIVAAVGAWGLLRLSPSVAAWWTGLFDVGMHPMLAPRLAGVAGSLFGFLIGGACIWGTRILGTLIAGREAMGMGDVHILAAVGAVAVLAYFAAPVSGLLVVLYLYFTRRQRELPYGPWLAVGTVIVMLGYDGIVRYLQPGLRAVLGG